MLRTDLTTALRALRRAPVASAVSIGGLALGMACCVWIGLYVYNEWSVDRFHDAADRIVRVTTAEVTSEGTSNRRPDAFPALAPAAVDQLPAVERALRMDRMGPNLLAVGERTFYEDDFLYADSTFFSLFDFPLRRGNPATALARPYSVVLPASTAQKYFGDANPVGKTITMRNAGRADWTFEVTGVMADFPPNTHVEADFIASMATFNAAFPGYLDANWRVVGGYTYLQLAPGAAPEDVRPTLQALVDRNTQGATERYGTTFDVGLQRLPDIHLHSDLPGDLTPGANPTALALLAAFGALVLLIASVNAVNLATARATQRRAEIGVRKAMGARRGQLARQFLAQTTLQAGIALVGAALLVGAAHPVVQQWLGVTLPLGAHRWVLAGLGVGVVGVVGLGAGSYPAFVLSRFRPTAALRQDPSDLLTGAQVRRGLLALQVGLAVVLVAATAVVLQQLRYVQTTDVGFERANVTVLETRFRASDSTEARRLDRALERMPGVKRASLVGRVPTEANPLRRVVRAEGMPAGQDLAVNLHEIDADALSALGMTLQSGRNLTSAAADTAAFLINRTAAQRFGWEAPLGKQLFTEAGTRMGRVVGVVEDVHYASLRRAVEPAVYTTEWIRDRRVAVQTASGAPAVLDRVRDVWARFYPDRPMRAYALDRAYAAQYQSEQRLSRAIGLFAGVALALAALGVLTLTAYTARRRTKEIGIRKALGATVADIVALLSKDVVLRTGAACVLALPVAYLAMQQWLTGFAYRADVSPLLYLGASGATLAVALIAVSVQAVRAAQTDPAVALRDE
jgi:putative ABC transport system permease protein